RKSATSVVSGTSGLFYALAGGLVYRRSPGDVAWINYSANLPSNPAVVDHLAISPDGTLFAAVGSTGSAGVQRVFRRPVGASGWSDFSAGLPGTAISALAVGATEVYVGTSNDVFASASAQSNWTSIKNSARLPLPLDYNAVSALAVGPDNQL